MQVEGAANRLLIDGKLVQTERTFPSLNPATGGVLGHAPDATAADARDSVAAVRRVFDSTSWATDVQFRIERKTIAAVVG